MCINYSATFLLPPLLNMQVAVYKFSHGIGFKRGHLSILVAINTGFLDCTDGVYILEMQQYPPLSVVR